MTQAGWTFCDTAIGRCAVAWNDRGIIGVQLPEVTDTRTRERLLQFHPGLREEPPPPTVGAACAQITALLNGEPVDLSGIAVDMSGVTPFRRQVYTAARGIPPGTTLSYGEVAARLGRPGAARAVGQALGCNPFPIIVPCHRVLAANGRLGGFSANGGVATKVAMLAIEGAEVSAPPRAGAPARPGSTPAGAFPAAPRPDPPGPGPQRALGTGPGGELDGLGFDRVRAVEHLRACDPALRRVIDHVGPFRLELKTAPTTFATLAEAIVYQQLGPKAAATIFSRVCALFSGGISGLSAEAAQCTADEELRAAGLSRPKLLALRDLAAKAVSGELPTLAQTRDMDDDAIIGQLTRVRGIGRWTAEMFLIFRLGRPDVLPADDYAIRRGLMSACGLPEIPSRDEVEQRGSQWKPYRTAASWYLWALAGQPLSSPA